MVKERSLLPYPFRRFVLTPLLLNEMPRVRADLDRQDEEIARLREELRQLPGAVKS